MIGRCVDVCERIFEEINKKDMRDLSSVIGMGASRSETRAIDKMAEDMIIESFPEFSILSEEAGFIDRHSDEILVVDPIDGTKNAVRGLPFYTVSIAVGKKTLSDISFGFVENPVTREIFHAERGKGSYVGKDKLRPLDSKEELAMLSMDPESYKHAGKLRALGYDIRSIGCSSLEMCYVATGAANAYLHAKKSLRVIDIAASLLFLREAGGECYAFGTSEKLDKPLTLEERFGLLALKGGESVEDLYRL
ncbi:MAG: inositol monophosphatase family protein [Candidatus Thermoplasmatota archaeon]|nr:inositol monophosphatase family protein [Candidatus Thermoplasmatota archaeon]